jgi:ADP-ribose pyrophosphatase YjhB (NUDIX family)
MVPDGSDADRMEEAGPALWADALSAIARTGLHYATSEYDRERYEQILAIAAEMAASALPLPPEEIADRWRRDVGYVTPKVGVEAAVFDAAGRLLLIRRPDTGLWALPGGWAEVGDSPAGGAVREVQEETGVEARPVRLVGVYDSRRVGSRNPHHFFRIVVACAVVGGSPTPTAEALEAVFFPPDALPSVTRSHRRPIADALAAWRDPTHPSALDA